MRFHVLAPFAAVSLLPLAACEKKAETPTAPTTEDAVAAATATATAPSAPAAPVPTEIPKLMHGRWGLVPADCAGDPAAAKGLIAIDAKSIKFYESRAVLEQAQFGDDDGFKGTFAFTGEGQSWKLDVALEVEGDNDEKLERKDFGPDAAPGTLEYTRCS